MFVAVIVEAVLRDPASRLGDALGHLEALITSKCLHGQRLVATGLSAHVFCCNICFLGAR